MQTYFRPASYPSEPKSKRAVHVDDDGTIYVPATILGLTEDFILAEFKKERNALLCFQGQYFASFDWLIKHCPAHREKLLALESQMRRDPSLNVPKKHRAGAQLLQGTDWMRHEENVAKIRQTEPERWDIGYGVGLTKIIPLDLLKEVMFDWIAQCPDGMTIFRPDNYEVNVYLFKESEKQRVEIMVREDAVEWVGEAAVAKFDAKILGRN